MQHLHHCTSSLPLQWHQGNITKIEEKTLQHLPAVGIFEMQMAGGSQNVLGKYIYIYSSLCDSHRSVPEMKYWPRWGFGTRTTLSMFATSMPPLRYDVLCYHIMTIKRDSVLPAGLRSLCLFSADHVSVWPYQWNSENMNERASSNKAKEAEGARNNTAFPNQWADGIAIILPRNVAPHIHLPSARNSSGASGVFHWDGFPPESKSHHNLCVQALRIWIYLLGSPVCYMNVLGQILFCH